jgi:hypothetical protein
MNIVFGRRDDTGYFTPRTDKERVDHLLERALKSEDTLLARKAEQAAKQNNSTTTINGRTYIWKTVAGGPGQMGRDGGFWMLEPGDYSHLTDGVPLTMNVHQMATALINASRKPPEREPAGDRNASWWETYLNASRQAQVDAVRDAVVTGTGAYKRTVDKDGNVTETHIPAETGPWFVSSSSEFIETDDKADEIGLAPWEREAMVDEVDYPLEDPRQPPENPDAPDCSIYHDVEPGDVVTLRSGSPHLTVEEVLTECEECGSPVEVSVIWWDFAESIIRRDRVLASSLEHALDPFED